MLLDFYAIAILFDKFCILEMSLIICWIDILLLRFEMTFVSGFETRLNFFLNRIRSDIQFGFEYHFPVRPAAQLTPTHVPASSLLGQFRGVKLLHSALSPHYFVVAFLVFYTFKLILELNPGQVTHFLDLLFEFVILIFGVSNRLHLLFIIGFYMSSRFAASVSLFYFEVFIPELQVFLSKLPLIELERR